MEPADFDYDLPEELIAQQPPAERSAGRLLVVDPGAALADRGIRDLDGLLTAGDLLVVNESRVIPARVHGRKASGGRIEMLVERLLGAREALVQLRASHAPLPQATLDFGAGYTAQVIERRGPFHVLHFSADVTVMLDVLGHVPLPPYIRRSDEAADRDRYQTLFARWPGSVAAPTAGLHFDAALIERLRSRGVGFTRLTLHVGAGTFAPLRAEQLATGRLHPESVEVGADVVAAVAAARAGGGRVIAVGTTVMRALETAAGSGALAPYAGETELFIRPGHAFRVADALITNFHLPRSSLLMLVCAFGGTQRVLAAYRHAVAARYRFFSYGDAMFVDRQATSTRRGAPP